MRKKISFHALHFAQHMNLAIHAYTQSDVHAVRSRTDLGLIRHLQDLLLETELAVDSGRITTHLEYLT